MKMRRTIVKYLFKIVQINPPRNTPTIKITLLQQKAPQKILVYFLFKSFIAAATSPLTSRDITESTLP